MQTGFAHERELQEAHRDAMIMSAIRVFCTFAQHDVALMHAAGITGNPRAMLANAVKHQMLHGHGPVFSEVMNKIITHHSHTPRIYKESERNMLQCVMQGYEEALEAAKAGPTASRRYRSDTMANGVMEVAHELHDSETTEEALDEFTERLWNCIDEWYEYKPSGPFEDIIHKMVLNAETEPAV
jgi:hypothetical protein